MSGVKDREVAVRLMVQHQQSAGTVAGLGSCIKFLLLQRQTLAVAVHIVRRVPISQLQAQLVAVLHEHGVGISARRFPASALLSCQLPSGRNITGFNLACGVPVKIMGAALIIGPLHILQTPCEHEVIIKQIRIRPFSQLLHEHHSFL